MSPEDVKLIATSVGFYHNNTWNVDEKRFENALSAAANIGFTRSLKMHEAEIEGLKLALTMQNDELVTLRGVK